MRVTEFVKCQISFDHVRRDPSSVLARSTHFGASLDHLFECLIDREAKRGFFLSARKAPRQMNFFEK